jgi:hypothetical protein
MAIVVGNDNVEDEGGNDRNAHGTKQEPPTTDFDSARSDARVQQDVYDKGQYDYHPEPTFDSVQVEDVCRPRFLHSQLVGFFIALLVIGVSCE